MTLDASGRLGIGTPSPNQLLHIEGNDVDSIQFKIKNNNLTNGNKYLAIFVGGTTGYSVPSWANSGVIESAAGTGSNLVLGNYEAGSIIFQVDNRTERMRIWSSGNVNIGATPASDAGYKLDVNGTARINGSALFNGNSEINVNHNSLTRLNVRNTTAGTGAYVETSYQVDSSGGAGSVGKYSSTTTAYKIIPASSTYLYNGGAGDLAILNDYASGSIKLSAGGFSAAHLTIAPTGAATFTGSVAATTFSGQTLTTSSSSAIDLSNTSDNQICLSGQGSFQVVNYLRNKYFLHANNGYLVVNSNYSPYAATGRGNVNINGATGVDSILSFSIADAGKGYLLHNGTELYIQNSASSGARVYVTASTGGVYLASGATSWTANSDIRLKNINSNLTNAVDKLMTLRAVNFSWKSDETNKENLGLIAQDVEKVFPQVIDRSILNSSIDNPISDKTEYLGVRYQELVPVLIAAIQEQQKEINELKQLINK